MSALIVLGVDPGIASAGVAVVEYGPSSKRILLAKSVQTRPGTAHRYRLRAITDALCAIVEELEPVAMGFENQAGVEVGMQRVRAEDGEAGTNYSSRKVHEVVGCIEAVACFYALPCSDFAPSSIKLGLLGKGHGHASKEAMRMGVQRFFGAKLDEHSADAVAVTVSTVRWYRRELYELERARDIIQ